MMMCVAVCALYLERVATRHPEGFFERLLQRSSIDQHMSAAGRPGALRAFKISEIKLPRVQGWSEKSSSAAELGTKGQTARPNGRSKATGTSDVRDA